MERRRPRALHTHTGSMHLPIRNRWAGRGGAGSGTVRHAPVVHTQMCSHVAIGTRRVRETRSLSVRNGGQVRQGSHNGCFATGWRGRASVEGYTHVSQPLLPL